MAVFDPLYAENVIQAKNVASFGTERMGHDHDAVVADCDQTGIKGVAAQAR